MDEATLKHLLILHINAKFSEEIIVIDKFLSEKACFLYIFPCNLFESNVKVSVIFQLSCPCNITAPDFQVRRIIDWIGST